MLAAGRRARYGDRAGLLLGTGYFEDLEPWLEEWLARGVITDAQYRAVKDRDLPDS